MGSEMCIRDSITDDRFALVFAIDENRTADELNAIRDVLVEHGVAEIKAKEFSDDDEVFESSTIRLNEESK